MQKKLEVNMTSGTLLPKILKFSIPLIFSNLLQILFNVTDVLTLGIFVSDRAVAAVGATSSLINLIIGLFVGLSVGANVMVANFLGKGDEEKVKRTIGMSIIVAVIVGVFLIGVGVTFARTFLEWTGCDPNVIDMATKYLRIYFLGMPIMMLYNFASAILRAAGETFRPLLFLAIGGVVNIGLNIFFILVVGLDVEGVAIATVSAQAIAGTLCIITLIKGGGVVKLERRYMKIYKTELIEMLKIGVPSGIQGCLFSLSNVVIQSSVNSFGEIVMAGNSYAQQLEAFVYQAMNGVALTALSFVSRNTGANEFSRVKKTVAICIVYVFILGLVMGGFMFLLCEFILGFITSDAVVIEVTYKRMEIICMFYFLCGTMDVMSLSLRGLGKSTLAMLVSLFGSCVLRLIWIAIFMKIVGTIYIVYWAYPVSWFITSIMHLCFFTVALAKKQKSQKAVGTNLAEQA